MQKLEIIRRLRGLSQKDLADKAGVAEATVYGIEGGHHAPRASTARKLAAALGVEVADLYGEAIPKAEAPSTSGQKAPEEFTQFTRKALELLEREGESTKLAEVIDGPKVLDWFQERVASGEITPLEAREQLRDIARR